MYKRQGVWNRLFNVNAALVDDFSENVRDPVSYTHLTLNSGYIVDERIYNDLLAMLEACNAAGSESTIKGGYISACLLYTSICV